MQGIFHYLVFIIFIKMLLMRGRLSILLLLLLFSGLKSKAQQISTDTFTVFTYGQEQGLSQLNALAMDFDSLGYLWVGTENGLNRFNGYTMKTYLAGETPNGLIDDHIRELYFSNDTIWLATDSHSLVAFLPKKNEFVNFANQLDFSQHPHIKYTNLLYPIDSTYLLLGTNSFCLLFDRTSRSFTILPLPKLTANDYVTSVCPLTASQLIIGTNNHGLLLLDLDQKNIHIEPAFEQLATATINGIYPFSKDQLLIATENGLYWLSPSSLSIRPALQQFNLPKITAIQPWITDATLDQPADTAVFLASANYSYILNDQLRLKRIVFQDLQKNPLLTEVAKVLKGDQGGYWLGTKGRGLFYYHPKFRKFEPLRITAANAPRADFISIFNFLRDGRRLWLATEFGFASYDLDQKTYKYYPSNSLEYTLAKDDNGTLWAGGFGEGLVRYNPAQDRFEQVPIPVGDKDVIQVTPINKDYIWVHTWSNGIFELNLKNYQVKQLSLAKKTMVRSRTSFKDHEGNIWIGSDEGAYRIRNGTTKLFDSLSNQRVFSITEDPQGNIWIGTAKGLNRIDGITDSVTYYTKESGLPNNFIYGVLSDKNGNIWCSTNFGISRFNPVTERFSNYTETDGLQNNEFNGKAAYQDDQGNLYFGGMNGFNIFNPEKILTNKHVGNTVIEDVQVFGKSLGINLPYTKELVLSHDQNVISFEYTALNYLWATKNLYQFMLEGFDKDWRTVTDFRSTTYTNLDPGEYTFKVRGTNNDGLWGPVSSLVVIIKGPWYNSLWFKILFGAFVLLVIFSIFLYKNYQQKQVNKRLLRMVEDRTRELRKANLELNESLELSEKQKDNIKFLMRELNHRVKNNLQIITSLIDIEDLSISNTKARGKLKLLQSRIFTVSRIHDILSTTQEKEEIWIDEFLEQLAKEIIAFSGREIRVEVDLVRVKYSVERLTYLGLILNELITNSLKHAFEGVTKPAIKLWLSRMGDRLLFVYQDNGHGFHDSPHSRRNKNNEDNEKMGVSLTKFLAEELQGQLDFSESTTARIRLIFPNPTKENGN